VVRIAVEAVDDQRESIDAVGSSVVIIKWSWCATTASQGCDGDA
jgi:hypothetical protein